MLTTTHSTIRILLIDDHSIVCAGLRMLIEGHDGLEVVGEANGVDDARRFATELQPDVILLDLDLAGDSGVELIPYLLEATNHHAKIILLTGIQDASIHREGIRHGALGLVKKDQAAETLVKAIQKVWLGEVWLDRTMTANVFREWNTSAYYVRDPEEAKVSSLTERERDVISLIGEGLKNKEIAARLFISDSTVRHHLTSVYDKLDVSDRLELVIYAFKHNLIQLSREKSPV